MKKVLSLIIAIISVGLISCTDHSIPSDSTTQLRPSISDTSTTSSVVSSPDLQNPVESWDGKSSERFEGGSGTATDPYRIANASQLAHLSKTVNSGTTYANKHFILTNDINLNKKEWTPIGNGNQSFQGKLDGNNHSIRNLNITKIVRWTNTSSNSSWGIAGLFGSCEDASLSNFKIDNATISVSPSQIDYVGIGALIGRATSNMQLQISNVRLKQVTISIEKSNAVIYEGGCIGYLQVLQNSWCNLDTIQCESTLSSKGEYANYLGGISGYIYSKGTMDMHDFVCYTDSKWPYNVADNYSGALGAVSSKGGSIEIQNAFSVITVNHELSHSNKASYEANAIIGVTYQSKDTSGSFKCKNLYGCVNNTQSSPTNSLYYIPINLVESNCVGGASLPSNHNLSSTVWNLSSKTHPVLK
jgi:hypothetical protein